MFIRLKTDAFDHDVIDRIFQLQSNNQWHFIVLYSCKIIFVVRNYETHDQKLLPIVMCFKNWKHYLKNNFHFIEILTDHNNLIEFINVQILNNRQIKKIMQIIAFDFVIKHKAKKFNSVNAFFKRYEYQNVNIEIIRLLFFFQKRVNIINALNVNVILKIRALCIVVFRIFF